MVKAYLRYSQAQAFGVVATAGCNTVRHSNDGIVYCGGLENVHGWNVRQGKMVCSWCRRGHTLPPHTLYMHSLERAVTKPNIVVYSPMYVGVAGSRRAAGETVTLCRAPSWSKRSTTPVTELQK